MEDLNYSIPYLIFTLLLTGLTVVERTGRAGRNSLLREELSRFGCVTLYLLFIGLRGYIGTDWLSYQTNFEEVPALFTGGWGQWRETNFYEPGFVIFMSACKTVWNNYHFFVFVSACLDMLILHAFLKRYVSWYTLGFLVFFVMGGLTLCELMRNVRAIGLFLLSLPYLTGRRALPYFALNLLGMCFHFSAFVYLPLYWLLHRRWPKALFVAVFLVGNLLFLLRVEYIRPLVGWAAETLGGRLAYWQAQYLLDTRFDEAYGLSIGYFERLLTSGLILGFYRKLHRQNSANVLFVNAYTLYFIAFFFFSEVRVLSARLSLLFIFAYWALIPALYETLRARFNRVVFLAAVYGYCLLKTVGLTAIPLYRYDNLLWGIEHYDRRADEFERYYLNR